MVAINIQNFVFSPYKIKSQFLVPTKNFINIFSPYKKFPSAFLVHVKNFHQHFWSLKCLRKMSQGLKSVIYFVGTKNKTVNIYRDQNLINLFFYNGLHIRIARHIWILHIKRMNVGKKSTSERWYHKITPLCLNILKHPFF